jgi:uncharacterized membrane-anchored protein YhcB (DUF1043 family)
MNRFTHWLNKVLAPRITKTYINLSPEDAEELEGLFEEIDKHFEKTGELLNKVSKKLK